MIRINLLAVERQRAKKKVAFNIAHKLTAACSLMLILAGVFIGWRYWTIQHDSRQLDEEIAAAQRETTRLHSIIQQVQQFEQRKGQLQQRVTLIEQLRSGQTGPVHMLDQISRAVPPMLWLTELKQNDKAKDEVLIAGRCTSLTALSTFVSNLEASGYFKRSVEIVTTTSEQVKETGELVKFEVKAVFQLPGNTGKQGG
jgi:type IV pilus assembly protein PilN